MQPLRAVSHTPPMSDDDTRLTVEARVEMVASIIGCVLADAYHIQQEIPHRPFHRLDLALRRVYEGIGRASARSLLEPDRSTRAERRAVEAAADVLDNYDADDEHLGVQVDPFVRRDRIKAAFLTAIHRYQSEMSRRAS